MVHVQRTFPVAPDVDAVVEYLADFAHAEAWDPGTKSCTRSDSGPIQVNATWHNVSELRGRSTELTYRLVRLDPGHLTFEGDNKSAHSVDDIVVRPAADGSEITYTADITFKGIARVAGPFLRGTFEKLGDETVEQMTRVLAAI